MLNADINLEEGKLDISFLSFEETHSSLLLVHSVLYYIAINHVHTRGRAPHLGDLLRPDFHVSSEHSPGSKILPFLGSLSPLREHNVRHKIQRHGLRAIPARKRIRMGGDKEDRKIIRIRLNRSRRKGIKIFNRRENPEKTLRVRPGTFK